MRFLKKRKRTPPKKNKYINSQQNISIKPNIPSLSAPLFIGIKGSLQTVFIRVHKVVIHVNPANPLIIKKKKKLDKKFFYLMKSNSSAGIKVIKLLSKCVKKKS